MSYNFDRVADQYDATRGFPPGVAEAICRWLLDRLPADPTVAEVGVGTGRIATPFIERGVRYSGFDISEQMVARLRAKLQGDLRRTQIYMADITEPLPVPAQSQDAVIAVHIFHLVDATKALHQVRRILKPHGALAWGYNQHDDLSPHGHLRNRFMQIVGELGHPQQRDFHVQQGRALLAEWGAQVSQHVVAAWTETGTPAGDLDRLRERTMSSTWEVPEHVLQEAVRRTEAWAVHVFGDLTQPRTYAVRFVMDWYQF
jgi:ubiquinone/menaquinone biosynthesis C-methylase UbiE